MFETAKALGGQLRVIAGMGGGGAIGIDMGAALALGEAKGCDMELLGGILPEIETALLARNNEEDTSDDFGNTNQGDEE